MSQGGPGDVLTQREVCWVGSRKWWVRFSLHGELLAELWGGENSHVSQSGHWTGLIPGLGTVLGHFGVIHLSVP